MTVDSVCAPDPAVSARSTPPDAPALPAGWLKVDALDIEAQGIADFQRIVAQGISPQLLEWKGIEATEKLAQSPNTKVVVIGNPKNGMPIILGGQ